MRCRSEVSESRCRSEVLESRCWNSNCELSVGESMREVNYRSVGVSLTELKKSVAPSSANMDSIVNEFEVMYFLEYSHKFITYINLQNTYAHHNEKNINYHV